MLNFAPKPQFLVAQARHFKTDLEGSSSLVSATANLKMNFGEDAQVDISYAHFIFNRLSTATAGDAYLRGNSVARFSAGIYNFVYQYAGDEVTLNSKLNLFLNWI